MTKREAKRAGWEFSKAVESVYALTDVEPDKKYTVSAVLSVGKVKVILSAYGRTKLEASARLLIAIEQYENHMPAPWRASAKAEGRG